MTTTDLVDTVVRGGRCAADPTVEHVVLLDGRGRPCGTVPKASVHDRRTPLHLAFSCHVVRPDGAVLLTRRSASKRTWPGVWTNACCGHPQLGETLRDAVTRRLRDELGVEPQELRLALPDFSYRAEMDDGTVEHELCPVLVVEVDGELRPASTEVDEVQWVAWTELVERAAEMPATLSPWCVEQVAQLSPVAPAARLSAPDDGGHGLLDTPVRLGTPLGAAGGAARMPRVAVAEQRGAATDVVGPPLTEVLDAFLTEVAAEAAAIDPALAEVTAEVRGLVAAGGKRLRPAFVYWGHRATGAEHDDAVLAPAGAVELLHVFALLHDDVMDRSATRRGRPAAHVTLAGLHAGPDPGWFGTSAAILAGDLTYVWADRLFDSTALPADAVTRARRVFTTLREEVVAGQYLDLRLSADPSAHELAALHVALLKSARYTVTRPLLLGAALADVAPSPEVCASLQDYGDAVGLAFQMRDDLLGLFGDPSETGKGALDDLREGKRTVLALRAMRLAGVDDRSILLASLGDPSLTEERADQARAAVVRSGAVASVEALIAALHSKALAAASALPDPARSALVELATRATDRRS